MSKLPVKLLNLFGGALAPSGNIAQFGSLAAGSAAFSNDPAVIQALSAWVNGLAASLINTGGGQASPTLEDLNGVIYVLSYQLAYLKQQGVAEWDPTVTYFTHSIAMDPSTGALYVSKVDNNTNNALSNATFWQTYASTLLGASAPLLKAWVTFDGRSGAILASYNVSNVTRTSSGIYLVTFTANMADANYGMVGSTGTPGGEAFGPGDDNIVTGGWNGQSVVRTVSQCSVFTSDPRDRQLQDAKLVSLQFFGNP